MHGKHPNIGQFILRIGLGILFLVAGLLKLFIAGGEGITGMLAGIGFPLAGFFAWLLIFAEIIGGALLISGRGVKWATIALGTIIVVAILTVQIQTITQDFPAQMQLLKDLVILTGLVSIYFGGKGKWNVKFE